MIARTGTPGSTYTRGHCPRRTATATTVMLARALRHFAELTGAYHANQESKGNKRHDYLSQANIYTAKKYSQAEVTKQEYAKK
jgi:hypothetical protein